MFPYHEYYEKLSHGNFMWIDNQPPTAKWYNVSSNQIPMTLPPSSNNSSSIILIVCCCCCYLITRVKYFPPAFFMALVRVVKVKVPIKRKATMRMRMKNWNKWSIIIFCYIFSLYFHFQWNPSRTTKSTQQQTNQQQ